MKDFYKTLGVTRTASQDEIKKAYRKLAKQYHPDRHKGDKAAEEKFKSISEAYDVLGDAGKRRKHDQVGQWTDAAGAGAPGGGYQQYSWTNEAGAPGGGPGLGDLGDIFEDLFGMAGVGKQKGQSQGRSPGFGGWPGQAQQSAARDLHYTMDIDFVEAANGTQAKISVTRNGKPEKITVKIPSGVHDGAKIRLAGKGEGGIVGNPGDLFITLKVKPHPYFRLEGEDVYLDVPITVSEAILGVEIKVPTLKGPVTLKIPPETSSGSKLRLKGRGVPRQRKRSRGDQYVVPYIVLPSKIGENDKQLAKDLAEKSSYDPRAGMFTE